MAWVGVRGLPLAPPQNRMCKFPFIRLKPFNGRRRSERPSRLAAGSSGIHCCRPRIKLRDRGRRAGLRVQGANHTRTITRKPCRLQSKSRSGVASVPRTVGRFLFRHPTQVSHPASQPARSGPKGSRHDQDSCAYSHRMPGNKNASFAHLVNGQVLTEGILFVRTADLLPPFTKP